MTPHPDNRFVAHFDMLGISALTKRDPDLAWEKLSGFAVARAERMHMAFERLDTGEVVSDRVNSFVFSDTVVAFTRGGTPIDAMAIIFLTTELFTRSLHYCIPLRGGIAHGRFAFNLEANLFSGPALVDAYTLGESSQWLGIVVDEYTANVAAAIPLRAETGVDTIVPWDVPLSSGGRTRSSVVNWVQTHKHTYCGPVPLTTEALYSPFAPVFGAFNDLPVSVARKYQNTVEFFNSHYE